MQPSAQEWRALAVRRCVGCQTGGSKCPRALAAGYAVGSSDPGCRGSAPTGAPHTRWRGFGPGSGRTPATGSASGPAITVEDRFARRWATSARSTMPARPNGRFWPPRAISIIRRHSWACAASSDSHARSCGSSSRPSGVTSRPSLNEKPAQGPVRLRSRTIRLHATAGPRVEASPVPVWPRCFEHNIHYAKSCTRRFWTFVGPAWQWLTKQVNLLPSAM